MKTGSGDHQAIFFELSADSDPQKAFPNRLPKAILL